MSGYTYRERVSFGETSLVGSVYFSAYVEWQGRCRERFLAEQAPDVVRAIREGELALLTLACSCDYAPASASLSAGDEVAITMRLASFRGARLELVFDYACEGTALATGAMRIGCKARRGDDWAARPFPVSLIEALRRHADDAALIAALDEALAFQTE